MASNLLGTTLSTDHPVVMGGLLIGLTLFVFLGLLAVPIGVDVAEAADTPETVTECAVIDEPGEYRLGNDLTGESESCIVIDDATDVTLDGNGHAIRNADVAIEIIDGEHITITNLEIEAPDELGIDIVGSRAVTLDGVDIKGARDGISILHTAAVTITNSSLDVTLRDGIRIHHSSDVDVLDTTITDTERNGLHIGESSDLYIAGNTVINENLHRTYWDEEEVQGIWTGGNSGMVIEDNRFEGQIYGVQIKSHNRDVVIRANHFERQELCAMDVKEYSRDVLIEDNTMVDVHGVGIAENLHNITFSNNSIVDSTVAGIWFADNVSEVTFTDNEIRDAAGAGLVITNEVHDVYVANNTITGSGEVGIAVSRAIHNATVVANEISDNNIGVRIWDTDGVALRDNHITENRFSGISLENTAGTNIVDTHVTGHEWDLVVETGNTDNIVENLTLWASSDAAHAVSLELDNVRLRGDTTAPQHPDLVAVTPILEVEATRGNPVFEVTMHLGDADLDSVDVATLSLWFNGSDGWMEIPSTYHEDHGLLEASVTEALATGYIAIFARPTAPEFEIEVIDDIPSRLDRGESIEMAVEVRNVGTTEGEFTVELRFDSEVVSSEVMRLEAGAVDIVTLVYTVENAGEFAVFINDKAVGDVEVFADDPGDVDFTPDEGTPAETETPADATPGLGVGAGLLGFVVMAALLRRRCESAGVKR